MTKMNRTYHYILLIANLAASASHAQWLIPQDTIRIIFGGDVMLARNVGEIIQAQSADYPWLGISQYLRAADIAVVNFECTAGTLQRHVAKEYIFQASPDCISGMARAGIDAAVIANNHIYDYFGAGVTETAQRLSNAGIIPIGGGINIGAFFAPRSFYIRGNWIAVIGLNDTESGFWGADVPGCAPTWTAWGESLAIAQIVAMSELGATVIAYEHWGVEYDTIPRKRQRELAYKLINAGAIAVIGSHPHRIQGIEFYGNGIIAYSLGNLIFDQRDTLGNIGALLELGIANGGIAFAGLLPTQTLTAFAQPQPFCANSGKMTIRLNREIFGASVSQKVDWMVVNPE